MSLHDNALITYHLYLKSHTEAPDLEAYAKVFNEQEAVEYFLKAFDLDEETIKANMEIV